MRRLTLLGAILVALAALSVGLTGCDEDKGSLIPNSLPGVELTAIPPAGDTTRYDIEFHWTGWDVDGEVDYFEYIIDPPLELIEDPLGFVDTLSWRRTESYFGRFTFQAPEYDTLTIDAPHSDFRNPQIGLGYHLFAIRAVDDMGAKSVVDSTAWVAFTAATICPRSKITSPPPESAEGIWQGGGQTVGLRVTFRWEGTDPDGIFNDRPVYYMYKLTDVTGRWETWKDIDNLVLEDPAPWDTLSPGQTRITLELDDGRQYGFAVRGVDEAGSVEPLLVLNRNLIWVSASQQSSFPKLYVRSTAFGNREWTGWFIDIEEYEVPLGSFYEFAIVGDADVYGGIIAGYSYGWNLPDPEATKTDPSGIGAWTPWSTTRTTISAEFTEAQDQFLFIRCKDDGGKVTLATLKFNVITLDPTQEMAYIDDWRQQIPRTPNDFYDDLNWQKMLEGYDYGQGWDELVWDEWEAPFGEEMPTLRFLSQFRTLVWSINDNRMIGPSQKSAWYVMSYTNTMNVLAVYLGSESDAGEKGKLWAFGRGLVESCVLPHGGTICDYPYSVNVDAGLQGCAIRPRDFAYDFLHIRGQYSRYDDEPSGGSVNLYEGTRDRAQYVYFAQEGPAIQDTSYVWDPDVNPEPYRNFPRRLDPDLANFGGTGTKRGGAVLLYFEILEFPRPGAPEQLLFYDPWFERPTGLIPLYKMRSQNNRANGKFCGFRYVPTGPTDHGEIVYMFFPMYPFMDDQIRQMAKAVLTDMFGLPDPDQTP